MERRKPRGKHDEFASYERDARWRVSRNAAALQACIAWLGWTAQSCGCQMHGGTLLDCQPRLEQRAFLAKAVCNARLDGRTVRYDYTRFFAVLALMNENREWRNFDGGDAS